MAHRNVDPWGCSGVVAMALSAILVLLLLFFVIL